MNKAIFLAFSLTFLMAFATASTPLSNVLNLQVNLVSAAVPDSVELNAGKYCYYLDTSSSQVESEYVKSAILQDTTGDFKLTFHLGTAKYGIRIYIPDAFTPPCNWTEGNTENIWTSFTQDYSLIEVKRLSEKDFIAPNWWRITIWNATNSGYPSGDYELRLFDMKAPSILGRYHFKIFLLNSAFPSPERELESHWNAIGAGWEDFPTVVVKGEKNPAYITGIVLQGDYYGGVTTLNVAGKVVAEGVTPTGRQVTGVAYFNLEQHGYYELLGLPAGTYTLTASAEGFPATEQSGKITLMEGQSLHGINMYYLTKGATITVKVWSKSTGVGAVPWGTMEYGSLSPPNQPRSVNIELYNDQNQLVAFTPYDFSTGFPKTIPTDTSFTYSLGGSTEYSGYVPYDKADYVNGLTTGTYRLKAFVTQYVQTEDYPIVVYQGVASITREMDLQRMGYFTVTAHFRESPAGAEVGINGTHILVLEALDSEGQIRAWNITTVPDHSTSYSMKLYGLWSYTYPYSLWYWQGLNDYGMPSESYSIKAYMLGYTQYDTVVGTIGYAESKLSFTMLKGASVNMTLRSVDWEAPPQLKNWLFDGKPIKVTFYDEAAKEDKGSLTVKQQASISSIVASFQGTTYADDPVEYWRGKHDTGLGSSVYSIKAYTVGYVQKQTVSLYLNAPATSNIPMNLIIGAIVHVNIGFRTQGILTPTSRDLPIRVLVYGSDGSLKGANMSVVPAGATYYHMAIMGFNGYAGHDHSHWANFYMTSDSIDQNDYGLDADTYTVEVHVNGYTQRATVALTVPLYGEALVNFDMYQLAHIHGNAWTFDQNGNVLPLSWAKISLLDGDTELVYTYSLDGLYELWADEGTYTLRASIPPYLTQIPPVDASVSFMESADLWFNVYMHPTAVPIPEFPATGVLTLISTLAASIILLRYRKQAIVQTP